MQQSPLLSSREVARHPEGSPARSLFEWWRALQFNNAFVASRYYSRSLEITPSKLEYWLDLGPEALALSRRPKLVDVDEQGAEATVFVTLETRNRNPNGRIDITRDPRAFNLVRQHGEWKLAENLYLRRYARIQQAFRKEFEKRQSEGKR